MSDDESILPLQISYTFDAASANVYDAWSDETKLKRWAWGSLSNDVQGDVDFRVGGRYRLSTASKDGERFSFFGEFLEIEEDQEIVYTVQWDAPMGYGPVDEKVTVEFCESNGRTKVNFIHDGVPGKVAREEHRKGWINTFETLDALLKKGE